MIYENENENENEIQQAMPNTEKQKKKMHFISQCQIETTNLAQTTLRSPLMHLPPKHLR
jgi:hypothetical protein